MNTYDLGLIKPESGTEPHERADAAANRQLILEMAARLFEERGAADVTMADIASEAGVGKGTLYRRFNSKAELAMALMNTQMIGFQNDVLTQMREFSHQGRPFLAQLDYFLDALVHFTDSHLPLLCVVQSDGLLLDSRERTLPYHWQHQTVSGLLRRANLAGELLAEVDVEYTADALLSPLRANVFRFQREVRGFSLERISSGVRTLLAGLQNQ